MSGFFIAVLLAATYSPGRRTLLRILLKKSVKQILVAKLILIGDVLDDSALHQSVSVDHCFTTVRSKADFD